MKDKIANYENDLRDRLTKFQDYLDNVHSDNNNNMMRKTSSEFEQVRKDLQESATKLVEDGNNVESNLEVLNYLQTKETLNYLAQRDMLEYMERRDILQYLEKRDTLEYMARTNNNTVVPKSSNL